MSQGSRMSSDERRRQLLEVGRRCFARLGYVQTTTALIAKEAGCSEPVLYRHFCSKRELFHVILIEAFEDSRRRFDRLIAERRNGAEKIVALVADFPVHNEERRELFRMIETAHGSTDDLRTAELMREYYDGYVAVLDELVNEGVRDGSIRSDVSGRTLAWFLIMNGIGFCLLSGLDAPVLAEPKFRAEMVQVVASLLAPR